MREIRYAARTAMVVLALVCALSSGITQAVVTDLSPAQLKASEAPPGFYAPEVKAYPHYVDSMDAGGMTCNNLALGLSVSRWKESQVQGFKSRRLWGELGVCSYLLDSARDAATTYQDLEGTLSSAVDRNVATKLTIKPKVGDGTYATWDNAGTINGTRISSWKLTFRHGLAVIYIEVDQPIKGFKTASLIRLGTLINTRLH